MNTRSKKKGFTLIELLVVIAVIAVLMGIIMPSLGMARKMAQSIACSSNLRSLMIAWSLYAGDNNNGLVACNDEFGIVGRGMDGRPNWFPGNIDQDTEEQTWEHMENSPLWNYAGKEHKIFKCPADRAKWPSGNPRTRSNSMSQVFGKGNWLDKTFGTNPSTKKWRIYSKMSSIINPGKTWVFIDEHPDSINDAAFAVACTGAKEEGTAQIIDFPANYHNGACGFSFADGHAIIKKWSGKKIKEAPVYFGVDGDIALNVPAGDSWEDIKWLAENTTVRN